MRKGMITSFLGLLAVVITGNNTHAQTTAALHPNAHQQTTKITYQLNEPGSTINAGALPYNEVSSKAIRSFEKVFKNPTNLQWYGVDKNKYLATFIDKERRNNRVLFSQNGYIIYAISYGDEQSLSAGQRRLIKSRYEDHSIGRVSEVAADGQKTWLVNLENGDTIIIARLTEDSLLDEIEHYQKRFITKKWKRQ